MLPVEAAHVFAPAENLADEAFDAGERGLAGFPGRFGAGADFLRLQQLEVECSSDVAVPQPGLLLPHRILVLAKAGQPLFDEIIQYFERLVAGHGPVKGVEPARMLRVVLLHRGDHLPGDRVGQKAQARRYPARALSAKRGTVVVIEVPLSAGWLVTVHQEASALAHPAVEVFQPRLPAALHPALKLGEWQPEVPVLADFEDDAAVIRQGGEILRQPPFAGLAQHHALRRQRYQRGAQGLGQRGVRMLAGAQMMNRAASRTQAGGEMPHGAQK